MTFSRLICFRSLHTTRNLRNTLLSENYTSAKLWEERLECPYLSLKPDLLKSLNDKMIMGQDLNNVELDIFANIATPNHNDTSQLRELLIKIKKLRSSRQAATIIPSTHHAICRLFLMSNHLPSLLHALQSRVEFGIFPDFYATNMILDAAIDRENLVIASKTASLVMLQENFGVNAITDYLSCLAVVKYLNTKTDFSDWKKHDTSADPIFKEDEKFAPNLQTTNAKNEDDEENPDEEYIRVPFLINPYNDGHFDLTDPRVICGKTLRCVSTSMSGLGKYDNLDKSLRLLGLLLEGNWAEASSLVESFQPASSIYCKDLAIHYIENLQALEEPPSSYKQSILSNLEKLTNSSQSTTDLLLDIVSNMYNYFEKHDVRDLRYIFKLSSQMRDHYTKYREGQTRNQKVMEQIREKEEHLKSKEEFLYFYDNLKKKSLTRIEYK